MNDEQVEELLFDFGLELDEIHEADGTYKIDVPANRYDLLCLQGLVNGVAAYLGSAPPKALPIRQNGVAVTGERPPQRPWIKLALLKGVDLSNGRYQDLIDFQDKLHQGLGQNRALMAIGTHNYDATVPPYSYSAWREEEIAFVPLNQQRVYTRPELDELYQHDSKLKEYLSLGRENGRVPVLADSAGNILALPPLINSELTKISPATTNVLIDVAGTDLPRVCTAMYLLLHHFSGPDTEIEEFDSGVQETQRAPLRLTSEDLKKELLLSITSEVAQQYLQRMMHQTECESISESTDEPTSESRASGAGGAGDDNHWALTVYPAKLRPDILHQCDLIEDIAIAHGYNNFPRLLSTLYSVGKEHPLNQQAQSLRRECALVGYTEVFTMALLSKNDCFGFGVEKHLQVKNPKSTECEVLRQSLGPSLLKCVLANQHHQLPIKLFEISDVGVLADNDVGVRNDKRLSMVIAGASSGLEDLQEAFDVVMKRAGVTVEYQEADVLPFLAQRSCAVRVKGTTVGHLGIIDPKTLVYHKIPHICSLVEISLTLLASLVE